MFLPNSRYAKVATVTTKRRPEGDEVVALKLRRLTPVSGVAQAVRAGDRVDLIAHEINGDATQFWHVADANTALDARTLVAEAGDTIQVPKA
jgi:hypothetical protein